MKCDHIKPKIYLYDELSIDERALCDKHIAECTSCAAMFKETMQQRVFLREAASWKEQPDNAALLTQKIMAVVNQTAVHKKTGFEAFVSRFKLIQLRFTLGMISLFLVVFFAIELNQPWSHRAVSQNNRVVKQVPKNASVLNTTQLFKNIKARKKKKAKQDCIKQVKLAGKMHVYNECQSGIEKFIRKYESN